MKKIFCLILYILLISPLSAKTEIDKAFMKRGSDELDNRGFYLYSPDIYKNQQIREDQVIDGFGCNGRNISPRLIWKNAPENVKSFAITMFDKDAKTDSGWWHWIVYNIPINIDEIDVNASTYRKLLPEGTIQGMNDYGMKKYGGICVGKGERHNYVITVYALDIENLDLPKNSTPAMISLNLNLHSIKKATIEAFYEKEDENGQILNNQTKAYKLNKMKSYYKKTDNKNTVIKKSNKNVVIENNIN